MKWVRKGPDHIRPAGPGRESRFCVPWEVMNGLRLDVGNHDLISF